MSTASVPLKEVCSILSGFAWNASKFNQDGRGIPIIRIQNVDAVANNEFVYWEEDFDKRFVIQTGDLLLTLSGGFRIESWSGPDALLNQRIVKLEPTNQLDRSWLLYVMRAQLDRIERMGKHALVNNVSLADLRELPIPLPPLAEQQRIAAILDQAEVLRAKRRSALAQLDTLNQSLFLDLFGAPKANHRRWPEVAMTTLFAASPVFGTIIQNWQLDAEMSRDMVRI
jgi:type I restriction enzyme S subunit